MNREELFAEIDALRLDIADPYFPRNFKNAAQARIEEIFAILYANDDGANDAEYELAEAVNPYNYVKRAA